jgi:tetratricopeptide (TPR) repeat protein
MKWPVLACLLAMLPATGASAGDFALCQQSVDAEMKFNGCNALLLRDPKFAEAYSGRALALVTMGETERAIADYTYAIGLDPGLMVAYYNRGLSFLEVDEPALAVDDFESVIARNPGDATAYNGRALAYAALGKDKEAEADFTRAIGLNPTYARAYIGRGNLTLSRRMFDTP